jgi:uncharacterized membrane protein (DUF485 family)
MYRPSLTILYVKLLGARGVWHEMMVTVIIIHHTVARGSMFGVLALYMGIVMARVTPCGTHRNIFLYSLLRVV